MQGLQQKIKTGIRQYGNSGASAVEFAIILPILVMLVFAAIDFGRLFYARLIIANIAREGGSIASREISLPAGTYSAANLISLLQSGARPLNMAANGRIYIWKIVAGNEASPEPMIDATKSDEDGNLNVASTIDSEKDYMGLNSTVYDQLVYDDSENKKSANISQINVVEVFYEYRPITPVVMSAKILSSRAIF